MADTLTFKQLVIEVADDLGCHVQKVTSGASSQTTEADDTVPIASLRDLAIDDLKYRYWYLALDSDLSTFRLVKSTGLPTNGNLVMTRGFASAVGSGSTVHAFMVLDPDNWKLACNNGLRDKYIEARFAVPFAADRSEYNLTEAAPWLKTAGQILRMRLRDENSGHLMPLEYELPVVRPFDDYGSVKLQLPKAYAQSNAMNKSMVISARRYYDKLTSDSDVIQIVASRLIRSACKFEALKLIFSTLGPAARQKWGQQMVLAEKELAEEEARWMPTTVKRDWQTEDERGSGDPEAAHGWAW